MSLDAIQLALRLYSAPASLQRVRKAALPDGIETLLAIAAGDPESVRLTSAKVGRQPGDVRLACAFFVEQVLLAEDADDHRVLGSSRATPVVDIGRRRKLLLRWLHPDVASQHVADGLTDRSMYAARVVGAWQRICATDAASSTSALVAQPAVKRPKPSAKTLKRGRVGLLEAIRSYFYGRSGS